MPIPISTLFLGTDFNNKKGCPNAFSAQIEPVIFLLSAGSIFRRLRKVISVLFAKFGIFCLF